MNYFIEQYVLDGGRHGMTHDAWANYRLTSENAHVPVFVRAGQYTVPISVDPEAFRETNQHDALFDQTIGNSPFKFP